MGTVLLILGSLIALGVLGLLLFIRYGLEPGGYRTREDIARFDRLDYFQKRKFQNELPTPLNIPFRNYFSLAAEYFKGGKNRRPKERLPVVPLKFEGRKLEQTQLTWFGHSAILLEIDGKTILIDPMLSERPSPVPFTAKPRFCPDLPAKICELPHIDLILLSHDHYDHLDYKTIRELHERTDRFIMPHGVGIHLRRWGVDAQKIEEYGWWDEVKMGSLQFTCVPARHFSGRGFLDRFTTLWCGWTIQGATDNIYFSGDSGYGPHFQQIGERLGPFDFAMLECGQYHEDWKNIHMLPEESARAGRDVGARCAMPIHWGAFELALHDWNEPVKRMRKAARENDLPLVIPRIGETIDLNNPTVEDMEWWEEARFARI